MRPRVTRECSFPLLPTSDGLRRSRDDSARIRHSRLFLSSLTPYQRGQTRFSDLRTAKESMPSTPAVPRPPPDLFLLWKDPQPFTASVGPKQGRSNSPPLPQRQIWLVDASNRSAWLSTHLRTTDVSRAPAIQRHRNTSCIFCHCRKGVMRQRRTEEMRRRLRRDVRVTNR